MYIEFVTVKGENILVNMEYVCFLVSIKKGTRIVLTDGTCIDTTRCYEDLYNIIFDK